MSTSKTTVTYGLSEFTSATTVNATIFAQELQDDGYVAEKPDSVYRSGSSVVLEWSVFVTQATLDAVDNAVTAHVGGDFASVPITAISEGQSTDNSGDEITKLTLNSGLLPAGQYLLGWYCESKTDAEVSNSGVATRLYVAKNGGSEVERGENTWPYPQYNDFSGSFPFTVEDGETYTLRLAYERVGASNPVTIQRARLYIVRVGD
jgi:hypothetical protein